MSDSTASNGLDGYFGIAGKRVLITGGTGGIGQEMSEAFAAAGARLVVASNDGDALDRLAAELTPRGVAIRTSVVDVRDTAQLDALIGLAQEVLGGIDILVCNAGLGGPLGSMSDITLEACRDVFAVNLDHPLYLASRVAPLMAAGGGGSIVLTSSIAGLRGNARVGIYALTKAALSQLARNLAVEWGPKNVRANAIAPGLIATSWAGALLDNPEAMQARTRMTPLRRIGEPREVASVALFLAGPASSFVSGHTLVVDGGTVISDGN